MASQKPYGDRRQTGIQTESQTGIETGMEAGAARKSGARCPICTAPTEVAFRPFCSRRCSDVDLSRWLRGGYAIPGRTDVDEDGDDSTAAAAPRRPSDEAGEDEDAS